MSGAGEVGRLGGAPTTFDRRVGDRLRQERLLAGVSRMQLGHELHIEADAVQAYESGKRPITAARLVAVLKVLGLPLSAFFYDGVERHHPALPNRKRQRVPGIVVERPPQLFSGRSFPEFFSLLNIWEARCGAMSRDLLDELLAGHLARKIVLLRQAAASSRLLVEQYGEGIAFLRPCQALALVGREYEDLPDRDFGRWLLDGYAATLATDKPRLESMLADIRTPEDVVMRSRFDRLLLPWHGIGGHRYVLSIPLIRQRSTVSTEDEPIGVGA
jgi:transcriptional regulator with XRE-family HTH domain